MKVKTLFSKITHLPSIGLLQVCLGIFIDMRVAVDLAIRKESFKYQESSIIPATVFSTLSSHGGKVKSHNEHNVGRGVRIAE